MAGEGRVTPRLRWYRLDVDNLDRLDKLELHVDASASLIVFLSAGYFASTNCRREVKHAVSTSKPLIIVKEDAFAKGGATMQELESECRAHTVDHSQEQVRYPLPPEVLEQVFGEDALSGSPNPPPRRISRPAKEEEKEERTPATPPTRST